MRSMQLYRATALIALALAVLLCAGYAAEEQTDLEQVSSLTPSASGTASAP
jgi:hypothetical protein